MPSEIVRFNDGPSQDVTFTSNINTTGGFNLAQYAGAVIMVKSLTGSSPNLIWYCKESADSSAAFLLADDANTPIQTSVQANRAYAVPDALFAAGYVTAICSAGDCVCRVIVKG